MANDIYNIGIQMKPRQLTKTFVTISNWKKLLVSMVYTQIFQRRNGWTLKLRKKSLILAL